ncbi:hypothetical protein [Manganibacter manganicus]|uniref:hypothetical protein n=1 Tax=Manganibacter manganicus TaxID=1873176 RepID=UPI00111B8EF5|nr:hypothetical protein [Pseudaminobacter manganicus]
MLFAISAAVPLSKVDERRVEHWPTHEITAEWRALGSEALKKPPVRQPDPSVIPYKPDGSYLNWAKLKGGEYRNTEKMKIDHDGLSMTVEPGPHIFAQKGPLFGARR